MVGLGSCAPRARAKLSHRKTCGPTSTTASTHQFVMAKFTTLYLATRYLSSRRLVAASFLLYLVGRRVSPPCFFACVRRRAVGAHVKCVGLVGAIYTSVDKWPDVTARQFQCSGLPDSTHLTRLIASTYYVVARFALTGTRAS